MELGWHPEQASLFAVPYVAGMLPQVCNHQGDMEHHSRMAHMELWSSSFWAPPRSGTWWYSLAKREYLWSYEGGAFVSKLQVHHLVNSRRPWILLFGAWVTPLGQCFTLLGMRCHEPKDQKEGSTWQKCENIGWRAAGIYLCGQQGCLGKRPLSPLVCTPWCDKSICEGGCLTHIILQRGLLPCPGELVALSHLPWWERETEKATIWKVGANISRGAKKLQRDKRPHQADKPQVEHGGWSQKKTIPNIPSWKLRGQRQNTFASPFFLFSRSFSTGR